MRHPTAVIALLALSLGASSCRDTTGPAAPYGIFVLESVDGKPLPYEFCDPENVCRKLLSGMIEFGAHRNFSLQERIQESNGTSLPVWVGGKYVMMKGSALLFFRGFSEPVTATIDGEILTMTDQVGPAVRFRHE